MKELDTVDYKTIHYSVVLQILPAAIVFGATSISGKSSMLTLECFSTLTVVTEVAPTTAWT